MDPIWLEVTVETTEPELETLAARLTMNGATGLVIEDEVTSRPFWNRTGSTGTMWTTSSWSA